MIKFRKVFSLVLISLICLSSFSSCEKAGTELADLMIIQGIGVDYEKGNYNVSVEILNNEQSGSPSGDSSSENKTKIYSIKGETVADALRLLTTKSGNLPLFAHNRVIVINENLNEQTVSDALEFFVRNYDSRASQLICISKGQKAEDIIRAKLLNDTVKSEILENLLTESYQHSLIPQVRVIDAVNSLENKAATLCVPAVTIKKNGENEDFELSGCAVFDENGKVSKYLSVEEAEGLAFLNNDVKEGFFTETLPNGEKATFVINKSKTRFNVKTVNGNLHYYLTVNISCDIDEIGTKEREKSDSEILSDLEKTIKNAVSGRIEATLNALQKADGGDCVRYCKILELKKPELYKTVDDSWKSVFMNVKTFVAVNVTIRRIGEETLKTNETA